MPIVSRTLTKLANREDIGAGIKKWRAEGVDARGRGYTRGPFRGTQAEADIIRDTVDWSFAMVYTDNQDALAWVQAGNLLGTFDFTGRDMTEEQAEEYVFAWFVANTGDDAMTVVWWMEQFNTGQFNAIRNRIGYTEPAISEIPIRVSMLFNAIGHYDNVFERPD